MSSSEISKEDGTGARGSRKILLPIDGSEHSQRAYTWYREHMQRSTDELHFLHIVEPSLSAPTATASAAVASQLSHDINNGVESAKLLGKRYLDAAGSDNIKAHFTLHLGSKPGEHLVTAAQELRVDMVVIGSRGIGTLKRTFLGSVSDHVLHHAHIPVIVVPPPHHHQHH